MTDPLPAAALPPGPKDNRLVQTFRFAAQPRSGLDRYMRELGACFTWRLLGLPPVVLLGDPEAVQDLFLADPEVAVAGESNARLFEAFLGKYALLNIDGERHRIKRKLLMPPFHGRRVQVYAEVMREITRRVMARWPVGRPFPLLQEMQNISLEVILQLIFGVSDEADRRRVAEAVLGFFEAAYRPESAVLAIKPAQIDLGPYSPWGRLIRRRRAVHDEIIASMARRRAAGPGDRNDVLSLLLDARDEDGNGMTDEELRDELFTLLLVGHETTATTLSWVWWCILERPDVAEKIRAEIRRVAGDGPLDLGRLDELVYLDAVINEAARLHPVTDGAARVLKRPLRLGRYTVPAGVMVVASTYLTHRNPAVWPEPERFMPERFLGKKPSPYAFLPFGGGARRCVGAAFALYEMKIIVSEVLSRADLRLAPGYTARAVRRIITVSPSKGVPVVIERLRAEGAARPAATA